MRAAILLGLLLAAAVSSGCAGPRADEGTFPFTAQDPPIQRALDWLRERTHANGCIGPETDGPCSHATTRDAVIAIGASGTSVLEWRPKGASPVDYLIAHEDEVSLEETPCVPCKWAKTAVAYSAAGLEVHSGTRLDPIDELGRTFDGEQFGDPATINGDAWALFAYLSAGTPPEATPIPEIREHLNRHQNPDGGWSWSLANESDVWTTATVLQGALAIGLPFEEIPFEGFDFLRSQMLGNGLLEQNGAESTESTALAIQAFVALGNQDFNRTVIEPWVDALVERQRGDGAFPHGPPGGSDFIATTQVLPALAGRAYPWVSPGAHA